MRTANIFAISLFAATSSAVSSVQANTLTELNARVVTAVAPQATSVSKRAGAQMSRGIPASFGRSVNPDFRSMVKLAMRFEMSDGRIMTEHCGGTAISSRWIVTAAHCVSPADGSTWNRIEIVTGDQDLDGPNVIRRTSYEAIVHGGFDYATLSNDVALLRLDEPLPRSIVPAKMDDHKDQSLNTGEMARAAGWPITGAKAGSKRLQTTDVTVSTSELTGYITVTSPTGQIEGVCQGESGGPLISWSKGRAQLAGVLSGIQPGTQNSSGEPCMIGGYEMYFTPIASHRQWIDKVRTLCDHNPKACNHGASQNMIAEGEIARSRQLASKRVTFKWN